MSNLKEIQAKLIGRKVRINNFRNPGYCIQHHNDVIEHDQFRGTTLSEIQSTFNIVPGLSGQGISFESIDYLNHYIRHYWGQCFLHKFDNNDIYNLIHHGCQSRVSAIATPIRLNP